MSRAIDILRERATQAALDGRAHDAAVITAVADLMDACASGSWDYENGIDSALAALERAITGR